VPNDSRCCRDRLRVIEVGDRDPHASDRRTSGRPIELCVGHPCVGHAGLRSFSERHVHIMIHERSVQQLGSCRDQRNPTKRVASSAAERAGAAAVLERRRPPIEGAQVPDRVHRGPSRRQQGTSTNGGPTVVPCDRRVLPRYRQTLDSSTPATSPRPRAQLRLSSTLLRRAGESWPSSSARRRRPGLARPWIGWLQPRRERPPPPAHAIDRARSGPTSTSPP